MVQDAFWYQGKGYGGILLQEAGSSSQLRLLCKSKCPSGIPRQLGFLDFIFFSPRIRITIIVRNRNIPISESPASMP